jgi:ADP-ribose pyrophosphatase YjhB (NUDIX family)
VISNGSDVLLLKRPQDDFMGGICELPSGNVEPGETLDAALRREVKEETSLTSTRLIARDHAAQLMFVTRAGGCISASRRAGADAQILRMAQLRRGGRSLHAAGAAGAGWHRRFVAVVMGRQCPDEDYEDDQGTEADDHGLRHAAEQGGADYCQ